MAVQSRAAETRQKLIDAAVDLFADNGYLETTPQHIAARADLTTGAFYYHFASREDVAAAIVDRAWPTVVDSLAGRVGASPPDIADVIHTLFSIADVVARDKAHRVGIQLAMATCYLSSPIRRAFQEQIEAFCVLAGGAFRHAQLRDGVSGRQAGELLWMALTGTQLISNAIGSSSPTPFRRLGTVWKSALRTIVTADAFGELERFIDETAERHERTRAGLLATATARVA